MQRIREEILRKCRSPRNCKFYYNHLILYFKCLLFRQKFEEEEREKKEKKMAKALVSTQRRMAR